MVTYFLNSEKNILEVTFRTIEDSDDEIRTDSLDYELVSEYGYNLETELFSFFDDENDDYYDDEKVELDEDELVSFLNEYYTVNPNLLPKSSPY